LHPAHARYLFQSDLVDMRGFRIAIDAWILAAPLAVLGDVYEAPFHFRYILWSIIAAVATWSLARRFCDRPVLATLLFLSVPAFVVNGNSLECGPAVLAMWMARSRCSSSRGEGLAGPSGAPPCSERWRTCGVSIGTLEPVLAFYLFEKRQRRIALWIPVLAAPFALGAWQLFELHQRSPARQHARGLHENVRPAAGSNKLGAQPRWSCMRLDLVAARRSVRPRSEWRWIARNRGGRCRDLRSESAVLVLLRLRIFSARVLHARISRRMGADLFLGRAIVFFAGSARYLLPIAAPVAILAVRSVPPRILAAGFALQMALALGLAIVNFQHWDAYRRFAASLHPAGRVWINAEWGLRYYLESAGGLAMPKDQLMQPATRSSRARSRCASDDRQLRAVSQIEIRPAIPLRIISLDGKSAYSSASGHALLPFEISTATIDRVRADA